MNDTLERCINRLKCEIQAVETSLAETNHHLTSVAGQDVGALEEGWKNAVAKCDAKREQAGLAGQRLREFLEEKKNELVAKFEDWKTDREIDKIERQAEKKEQQAVDAVVVAAFALLEAEVAIMEALKARKLAIEVAG